MFERSPAGNWEKAHVLLKNNPNLTGLDEQLESYGKTLEDAGRIKEAEKLYLALDKADLAINMYKNFQRYDEVRLRACDRSVRVVRAVEFVLALNEGPLFFRWCHWWASTTVIWWAPPTSIWLTSVSHRETTERPKAITSKPENGSSRWKCIDRWTCGRKRTR